EQERVVRWVAPVGGHRHAPRPPSVGFGPIKLAVPVDVASILHVHEHQAVTSIPVHTLPDLLGADPALVVPAVCVHVTPHPAGVHVHLPIGIRTHISVHVAGPDINGPRVAVRFHIVTHPA